jgi:hypothetical protein
MFCEKTERWRESPWATTWALGRVCGAGSEIFDTPRREFGEVRIGFFGLRSVYLPSRLGNAELAHKLGCVWGVAWVVSVCVLKAQRVGFAGFGNLEFDLKACIEHRLHRTDVVSGLATCLDLHRAEVKRSNKCTRTDFVEQ